MSATEAVIKLEVEAAGAAAELDQFGAKVTKTTQALDGAAASAQRSGNVFGSAFRDNLGGVAGQFSQAASAGGRFSNVMAGIAGGMVAGAVTAGISAIGSAISGFGNALKQSVLDAAESEQAFTRLSKSLTLIGAGGSASSLSAFASSMSGATLHTDEAIMAVEQLGAAMNVPVQTIPKFTMAAADLASALGIDLNTAAKQLAQTLDGDAGRLKQLVPELAGLTEAQLKAGEAIDVVSAKFRGMAVGDADTLQGSLASVKKEMGELSEAFGVGLTASGDMQKGVSALADTLRGLRGDAETLGETISQAFSGENAKRIATMLGGANLGDLVGKLQEARERGANERSADEAFAARGGGVLGGLAGRQGAEAEQARMEAYYSKLERREQQQEDRAKQIAALEKEREAAAKRAADDAEREAKQAEAFNASIGERLTMNEALATHGRTLYEDAESYLAAYKGADQATESLIGKLQEMVLQGKMAKDEALTLADALRGSMGGTFADRTQARISGQGDSLTDVMSVGGESDAMAGAGYVVSETQIELAQQLLDLDTQQFELQLLIAEQGYASMEQQIELIDLKWQEAEALGTVSAAEADLAAQREKAMAVATQKAQKDREMGQIMASGMSMVTQATGQLGAGLMKMALTGEGSFKQLAQATLQGLAIQSAGKAVFELAEGFAALALQAMGHPTAGVSAGMHFKSAAMFGVMAAGFGGMSAAAGQPGGESGGGVGGGATDDSGFGDTRRATRDTQQDPMPRVQITLNGVIGDQDAVARHVSDYVTDALRDSGGRSGSMRG